MSTVPGTLTAVEDALQRLLAGLRPTAVEELPLTAALGRVLATDVLSSRRLPGCDNSAMDGYAVRADDCAAATPATPAVLPVRGEVRAGSPVATLAPGAAMSIMTGAPIPRGADAVVPIEDTQSHAGDVVISAAVTAGAHVRRVGTDISPGMVMVPAGRRLRPVDIAAAAAAGAVALAVHRRPRVAVLGGGDELVPPGVEPAEYQVTDSNTPMLAAAVSEAGGEAVVLGVMADERDAVRGSLLAAAACDLVISSAGVSVGAHDHVRAAVEELGNVHVWRVAIRPGKPLLIGEVQGTPLLGLPGNPVSSAVTFEVFGRPAILALQGAARVQRRRIAVRMGEGISTPRGLQTYLRVRLDDGADGVPVARLSGHQGSSMLRSLADADALLVVDAATGDVPAGTLLTAIDLS